MNHANHAYDTRIDFVVHGIREAAEQNTPETTPNHRMPLRRLFDSRHRVVQGGEELLRRNRRAGEIPLKGFGELGTRKRAYTKLPHLPELTREIGPDLRPSLASLGGRVGLYFAAVQLGGERLTHWRRGGRIETIPQLANEFDSLFSGEIVNWNRVRGHDRSLTDFESARNGRPATSTPPRVTVPVFSPDQR